MVIANSNQAGVEQSETDLASYELKYSFALNQPYRLFDPSHSHPYNAFSTSEEKRDFSVAVGYDLNLELERKGALDN